MISAKTTGSFDKTNKFLTFLKNGDMYIDLEKFGQQGVNILSSATPRETGETAHSWDYVVVHKKYSHTVHWLNTHVENGVNIAVILQYGHGTGTGGWVEGIDYINPAVRPLFDKMVDEIWRQVKNA